MAVLLVPVVLVVLVVVCILLSELFPRRGGGEGRPRFMGYHFYAIRNKYVVVIVVGVVFLYQTNTTLIVNSSGALRST